MTLTQSRPSPEVSILLAAYEFIKANKLFRMAFVMSNDVDKDFSAPVDGFLSLSSYLSQNAYRTSRATIYSYNCLLVLRLLIEDQAVMKSVCDSDSTSSIRLCRQTQPLLPLTRMSRPRIHAIIDVLVDGVTHNLRKRLDVELYMWVLHPLCMQGPADDGSLLLVTLFRIVSFLSRSRTRLSKHQTHMLPG